jgi:hypothetical protein
MIFWVAFTGSPVLEHERWVVAAKRLGLDYWDNKLRVLYCPWSLSLGNSFSNIYWFNVIKASGNILYSNSDFLDP